MRQQANGPTSSGTQTPPASLDRGLAAPLTPSGASPAPIVLNEQNDWMSWDSLTIRIINGLPKWVTTLDLWYACNQHGSLDMIEIFEPRQGQRDVTARIRFRQGQEEPVSPKSSQSKSLVSAFHVCALETLAPESLDFGIMYDPSTMMVMHENRVSKDVGISFELNLERRRIDVCFDLRVIDPRDKGSQLAELPIDLKKRHLVGGLNRMEKYRFRIPFDQLDKVQEIEHADGRQGILMSLDTPPSFYRKAVGSSLISSHDPQATFWTEWDTWFRQTDLVYEPLELRHARLTLRKARPVIDIGRWTTYCFTFSRSEAKSQKYSSLRDALRDHNVKLETFANFKVVHDREPAIWEWIDKSESRTASSVSGIQELGEVIIPHLSFPVRYQLEVCISHGCLNEHNLSKDFVDRLVSMEERKALDVLEFVSEQKQRIFDPMTIFDINIPNRSATRAKIPHYCIHMRKATVTPSMIYFSTPTVETSNRVVRQYSEHADRFLRVSFTDEQFQGRIHSSEKETNAEVLTRIKRAMINGISIGERHFHFLAFGNAQFRDHGAYFFAPTLHVRVKDIRGWMGDFESIRIPAKYAARIGQCFSTTRAIKGTGVDVKTLPDIVLKLDDGRSYTFTDGVGKISKFLAQLISSELGLQFIPSVFQFRLGGCKGVLAVWPDAGQKEVHIRYSQYKFAAVHNGLEIIRWSQFAAAALNRQIITVLSTLGVDDEVFVRKLQAMLEYIRCAMWDESVALSLLQKYIDPNRMTLVVASMILDGFQKSEDPFARSMLRLWRAWSIKYLKEHARIIIEDGAFVFGCVDETGTLKGHQDALQNNPHAGEQARLDSLPEIFIQVPDPDREGQYKVIEDLCLLARNPSLHPGDVRLVRAVNQPGLSHLRDVVVLPQKGDRDVAGMCSGGDLDGDDYLVIWDKELIPPEWNHMPMDYTPPPARTLDRPVEDDDITDFFVQYMKNDALGSIAHAHLARADRSPLGVKDEKCLELADLHSMAVDYAKTGEPARLPRKLRPREYPHFMEKAKDKTYVSEKVLGQLYDQVERVDFIPVYDTPFDQRVLKAFTLDEKILEDARALKKAYDTDLRRVMAQHDIRTEFEVWSTFVLHHSGETNNYKFHEEIGRLSSALKDRHREACIEKAGGRGFDKLGPFVAAMYTVTCHEISEALAESREKKVVDGVEVPRRRLHSRSMPFMSFPWCFQADLGKIANTPPELLTGDLTMKQAEEEEEEPTLPEERRKRRHSSSGHNKVSPPTGVLLEEDTLQTAEGVTHRGEILELFKDTQQGEDQPPEPSSCAQRETSPDASSSRTIPQDSSATEKGFSAEANGVNTNPNPDELKSESVLLLDAGEDEDLIDFGDHEEDDDDVVGGEVTNSPITKPLLQQQQPNSPSSEEEKEEHIRQKEQQQAVQLGRRGLEHDDDDDSVDNDEDGDALSDSSDGDGEVIILESQDETSALEALEDLG
ncbi:MAG: hypothetical protein M1837_000778 [Sclerophora amabilis]|nr:MAG: hypothetical protein M1837_000778 [Sclerophora amabilis]